MEVQEAQPEKRINILRKNLEHAGMSAFITALATLISTGLWLVKGVSIPIEDLVKVLTAGVAFAAAIGGIINAFKPHYEQESKTQTEDAAVTETTGNKGNFPGGRMLQ